MENVVGRMELLLPTGIDILFLALCGLARFRGPTLTGGKMRLAFIIRGQ